jgi:2',3'-cyclic-nucleotide 2'-phosphodiesterase (5'-nucleotidase family)
VESPVDVLEHLLPQVEEQADFIVLLSNFSPETNREIAGRYGSISAILSPDAGNVERVGEVLLAYSSFKGKTVGALMLNDEGGSQFASAQQIALTEAVADEPNVRALLTVLFTSPSALALG